MSRSLFVSTKPGNSFYQRFINTRPVRSRGLKLDGLPFGPRGEDTPVGSNPKRTTENTSPTSGPGLYGLGVVVDLGGSVAPCQEEGDGVGK